MTIKVILTEAGTSAYVGNSSSIFKYMMNATGIFKSVATTDIVAHPQAYLKKEVPTV